MKNRFVVMAVLAGCLALSACSKPAEEAAPAAQAPEAAPEEKPSQESSAEKTPEAEPEDTAEKEPEQESPEDLSEVMVGMVASPTGIMDESFNQSAWEGLQRLSGTLGCQVKYLESDSIEDIRDNLEALVEQGCDLCWGVTYDCRDAVLEAAEAHPEARFAIIDYVYDDEGVPDNVTCIKFRAAEPSFLAGYVAGSVTETGMVGFVGGEEADIIEEFMYGYRAGVDYAAKEKGSPVEVRSRFADSFSDVEKGKELAKKLYDDGCDIVYHAAGMAGVGVIDAARETGNYAIGVDKDQAYLAPEAVLTSAMKYVNSAVNDISKLLLTGDEDEQVISLGIAENAEGISEDHSLYSDEIYDSVKELEDQIRGGELDVPADEEEYLTFRWDQDMRLPAYTYGGSDPYLGAAGQFLLENFGTGYSPSDISIPVMNVVHVDDSDKSDVKLWGEFWVENYVLNGHTLDMVSGGAEIGLIHIDGNAGLVKDVDMAGDGSSNGPDITRIFGDELEAEYHALTDEKKDENRRLTIKAYVDDNGLDIDSYKDYGWKKVMLDGSTPAREPEDED